MPDIEDFSKLKAKGQEPRYTILRLSLREEGGRKKVEAEWETQIHN